MINKISSFFQKSTSRVLRKEHSPGSEQKKQNPQEKNKEEDHQEKDFEFSLEDLHSWCETLNQNTYYKSMHFTFSWCAEEKKALIKRNSSQIVQRLKPYQLYKLYLDAKKGSAKPDKGSLLNIAC